MAFRLSTWAQPGDGARRLSWSHLPSPRHVPSEDLGSKSDLVVRGLYNMGEPWEMALDVSFLFFSFKSVLFPGWL